MTSPLQSHEALSTGENSDMRECMYKVLVVGDIGTGKTSFIKRYVHNIWTSQYKSTIGVDFALKIVQWSPELSIRLQLWDIAGQERFGNMTRSYYKGASGAFVVFDITRPSTFESVVVWKQDIDSKVVLDNGTAIPVILLANKCDLARDGLQQSKTPLEKFCQDQGFFGWYETSSKENINVEVATKTLITKMLENDPIMNKSNDTVDPSQPVKPKSSCC